MKKDKWQGPTTVQFSSVQSLSRVQLFATPWITAHQASLSTTNSQSSLKLTSIESAMPFSHLILCRPLLLLPSIPPSITVFSNESTLHMSSQSTGVSALASVLPKNTQDWSPCSPRDSQESFPTSQFKSINSSLLSFLHSPSLTSIHDHWKNHSESAVLGCNRKNDRMISVSKANHSVSQ